VLSLKKKQRIMKNTTMNKEMTLTYLNKLVEYAGKRRFQKIFSLQIENKEKEASMLLYKYNKITFDCFEMSTFDDRLRNKGFQRNSSNAVELYMKQFIEVIENAKLHKIF